VQFLTDSYAVFACVSPPIPAPCRCYIQDRQRRDRRATCIMSRISIQSVALAILVCFVCCFRYCKPADPCFISILHTSQTKQGSSSHTLAEQKWCFHQMQYSTLSCERIGMRFSLVEARRLHLCFDARYKPNGTGIAEPQRKIARSVPQLQQL
jgi:hypothetical protein